LLPQLASRIKIKKSQKSCQKVVKGGQKVVKHFVSPGKKPNTKNGAIVEKVRCGNSKKVNWWNNKNKNRIVR
jgi:hypothetical protein